MNTKTLSQFPFKFMDSKDRQITRAVAFKGAIEMLAKSPDSWNSSAIINEVRLLTDEFETIILNNNANT